MGEREREFVSIERENVREGATYVYCLKWEIFVVNVLLTVWWDSVCAWKGNLYVKRCVCVSKKERERERCWSGNVHVLHFIWWPPYHFLEHVRIISTFNQTRENAEKYGFTFFEKLHLLKSGSHGSMSGMGAYAW